MKTIFTVYFAIVASLADFAASSPIELRVQPTPTKAQAGKGDGIERFLDLSLWVTNVSDAPVRVLAGVEYAGTNADSAETIVGFSRSFAHAPSGEKLIPADSDLRIATLEPGEAAFVGSMRLNQASWRGDAFRFRYAVDEALAKRFRTWGGVLEARWKFEFVKSLTVVRSGESTDGDLPGKMGQSVDANPGPPSKANH